MSILLLAGSPSSPSRSTRLLNFVGEKLTQRGHKIIKLEVRDLPGNALLRADFNDPEVKAALALVAGASAVVVATPVYKAAYSGALKTFLDLLPQFGLAGKLVLPLATGGSQSHMLALDYALRPVLSSLAARHVLPSIYATEAQVAWTDADGLWLEENILARVQEGVEQLSDSLQTLHRAAHSEFLDVQFAQIQYST
ncbi:NADPH-dependent FMN reductase [Herbaspirillum sp. RTI4]|uniref:NADPH-dependent FMN reductase n=1 Tax=Herbaspirillum sp. RTI4 TaxID=3048640 RepID=UPI002AB4C702|nr:NADPH-dependent FMN reductase [Herbaspirillum sp. RTI4]MDY7579696.1 NADPH-dependent FMN reductase [Herbaspirillum sp. RTI4]MEA9983023.1 NADPH-dependent FMN reductase [Herbaspirillum sp. RTI4]